MIVPNGEIVKVDELPPTWGLIIASGQRLKTVVKAPRLRAAPMNRNFMALIVKRAVDSAVKPYLTSKDEKLQEAEDSGFDRGKQLADRAVEKLEALQKQVRDFEASSGIHIQPYQDMRELGDAVRAVMSNDNRADNVRRQTQYALNQLRGIVENMEKQLNALDTIREKANGAGAAAATEADGEPAEAAF